MPHESWRFPASFWNKSTVLWTSYKCQELLTVIFLDGISLPAQLSSHAHAITQWGPFADVSLSTVLSSVSLILWTIHPCIPHSQPCPVNSGRWLHAAWEPSQDGSADNEVWLPILRLDALWSDVQCLEKLLYQLLKPVLWLSQVKGKIQSLSFHLCQKKTHHPLVSSSKFTTSDRACYELSGVCHQL